MRGIKGIGEKRGFTLVVLITIAVIIMILTTTVVVTGTSAMDRNNKTKFATEVSFIQQSVNEYVVKNQGAFPVSNTVIFNVNNVSDKEKEQFSKENVVNGEIVLYEVDMTLFPQTQTVYGNKKERQDDMYVVSKDTGRVYYAKGVKAGSSTYYTLNDELSKLINYDKKEDVTIRDGIIFKPSSTQWTNQVVTAEIKVPNNYTNVVVKVQENGKTDVILENTNTDGYFVFYSKIKSTDNASNYDVLVTYTKPDFDTENTQKFTVSNFDNISPTVDIGTQTKVQGSASNPTHISIPLNNIADDRSGVKAVKYESAKLIPEQDLSYFKSSGISVEGNLITVPEVTEFVTIYLEDNAGNSKTQVVKVEISPEIPGVKEVTMISNNTNRVYARNSNEITVNIEFETAIYQEPTVLIGGRTATVAGSGATRYAKYTIPVSEVSMEEGPLSLNISGYKGASGQIGQTITEVTKGQRIIYDRTILPTIFTPNGGVFVRNNSTNQSTIKSKITTQADVSGIVIKQFAWGLSSTVSPTSWNTYNDATELRNTVTATGTYYLWTRLVDNAGNEVKRPSNGFIVGNEGITISPNTTTPARSVTLTLVYGPNLTQNRRYKIGASGTWTNMSGTTLLIDENNTIYFSAQDTAGNEVNASIMITNIDKTPPTATVVPNSSSVQGSGGVTVAVEHFDNMGINVSQSKWALNQTAGNIGLQDNLYTGGFSTNPQSVTGYPSSSGTYYMHVLSVDLAGNKTETISTAVSVQLHTHTSSCYSTSCWGSFSYTGGGSTNYTTCSHTSHADACNSSESCTDNVFLYAENPEEAYTCEICGKAATCIIQNFGYKCKNTGQITHTGAKIHWFGQCRCDPWVETINQISGSVTHNITVIRCPYGGLGSKNITRTVSNYKCSTCSANYQNLGAVNVSSSSCYCSSGHYANSTTSGRTTHNSVPRYKVCSYP